MLELRYDCGRGLRDDVWMLPVKGARSDEGSIGSSRSLMLASHGLSVDQARAEVER